MRTVLARRRKYLETIFENEPSNWVEQAYSLVPSLISGGQLKPATETEELLWRVAGISSSPQLTHTKVLLQIGMLLLARDSPSRAELNDLSDKLQRMMDGGFGPLLDLSSPVAALRDEVRGWPIDKARVQRQMDAVESVVNKWLN